MGFNVSVHTHLQDESRCSHFLDRAYYVFVVTYENFKEESVVARLGEMLELDLAPLCRLVYGLNINPSKKYWQDAEMITKLIEDLIRSLQLNPEIIDEIDILYPQDADFFREYIRSGELVIHLFTILKIIKCLREKGAKRIFFSAG